MKYFFIVSCLFYISAFAQIKPLTIEEATLKGRTKLAPARLQSLQAIKGTDDFSYVDENKLMRIRKNGAIDSFTFISPKKKTLSPLAGLQWFDKELLFFTNENGVTGFAPEMAIDLVYKFDLKEAENIDYSANYEHVAFTKGYNLYVQSLNGKVIAVSKDGKNGLKYGTSVHQQEFGIEKGTFWSNRGEKLAFYRMDESMVGEYPIYELQNKPATARFIHYPMAGTSNHKVTVGVFDIKSKKTIYLKTNNTEAFSQSAGNEEAQFLTNIAWTQDDKYIVIGVLNRAQNHVKWQLFDSKNGNYIRTIFEEKNDKYTEPLQPFLFLNNNDFIYQSQRSGFNSLYKQNIAGNSETMLTENVIVVNVNGTNHEKTKLYFDAIAPNSIDRNCYELDINSKKIRKLNSKSGQNSSFLNDTKSAVIIMNTALDATRTYDIIDLQTLDSKNIFTATNPLEKYEYAKPEITTIKAHDGTTLFARMVKPYNFSATKKYPVIVYVYGGPHAQMVSNTWNAGADLWMNALANEGFIVFTLDNRGSGNRGLAFEQATFRRLADVEMDDQLAGVEYLKKQSFVDADRIGVHGWSYGGFMTTSLLTRHPEVFKVGVAGGAVIDWSFYEIMYTERYMDTPQENPEGYAKNSLFQYIPNLKGKLLHIHGTSDNVVLWQHTLRYIQECVKQGKQVDYFVYPEHEHNVLGKDRAHLIRKVAEYFKQNL